MKDYQLDHIVHLVNDVDESLRAFENFGLYAFYGGSHESWGTHNGLSYFGLSYVEFLAIEDKEKANHASHSQLLAKDAVRLLPANELISRMAIRTNNIEKVAEKLGRLSLEVSPILQGSRLDKARRLIEWKMLMIDGDYKGINYPFFIEWKETDEERLQRLQLKPHKLASHLSMAELMITASNPKEVAKHWHDIFKLPMTELPDSSYQLRLGEIILQFQKGSFNGIAEVVFKTKEESLNRKALQIGKGKYVFV